MCGDSVVRYFPIEDKDFDIQVVFVFTVALHSKASVFDA